MLPLAWLFLIVAEEGLAVLVFVNVACIRECCGFMDSTLAGSSRTHCARCPALSAFCRMNRRSFSPELREGVQEPLAHTTSFFVYEVRFMHRSRRQGQINPTTQAHTHTHTSSTTVDSGCSGYCGCYRLLLLRTLNCKPCGIAAVDEMSALL